MDDNPDMKGQIGQYFAKINQGLFNELGEKIDSPEAYMKALCIFVGTEMHNYKDILHTRQVLEYMNEGLAIALKAEQMKNSKEKQ